MLKYIVKRLLWIIPVLIGVTIIVFTILYFSPGDPAYLALGDNATPEAVEAYRVEMGINGTYWERSWPDVRRPAERRSWPFLPFPYPCAQ